VINDQIHARVHLVADTVGGEGMLRLLTMGRAPGMPSPPNWTLHKFAPTGAAPVLEFETVNVPKVMSPWELREHLNFLLAEAAPNQPVAREVARLAFPFLHRWRALWSAHGDSESGWPSYRALLNQFVADLMAARARDLLLVNEVDFFETISSMILGVALYDRRRDTGAGEQRTAPAARANA
jgi:hypothetical protein